MEASCCGDCGSPISSKTEFSVVTEEEQCTDGVRERKLLHWVNSLPLTKCLLVEELRDLRFGDVLLEVVQWLQNEAETASEVSVEDDSFANDAIVERLRRVVQFAASECRSQDEGAMYVVNHADCVKQVVEGQSDAICAVLTVLKRLSIQRIQDSRKNDRDALQRRRAQEEMIKYSLEQPRSPPRIIDETVESKQEAKRVPSSRARPRTRPNTAKTAQNDRSLPAKSKDPRLSTKTPAAVKRKSRTHHLSNPGSCAKITTEKEKISNQSDIFHDDKGLRVFGMLDPTAKPLLPGANSHADNQGEDALAMKFCTWAQQTLQIGMPLKQIFVKRAQNWKLTSPRRVRQVFANGVLLCRIAFAILQQYGELLKQSGQEAKILHFDGLEAIADPQTPIDRRHNLALAGAIFEVFGVPTKIVASFESLQCPGKLCSSKALWGALNNVSQRVRGLAHVAGVSSTYDAVKSNVAKSLTIDNNVRGTSQHVEGVVGTSPTRVQIAQAKERKPAVVDSSLAECAPLKRNLPYITSEQMHVVNEWLTLVGFDPKKAASCGVLQDSMRNGSLLCVLLTQVLKCTSFPFFKTPRTLTETRENISKAVEKLGELPREQIPRCYLSPSAEQAVLIGDRQVNYGILWHLWQVFRESHKSASPAASADNESTTRHPRPKEKRKLETKVSSLVHPSPLLLDIPAVTLAGQGKLAGKADQGTSIQIKLHESFARRLAWSKHDPQYDDNDDDLFPVPKAPFSSPVYSEQFYPETPRTHEYDLDMDILPVRTDFRTVAVVPSKLDQELRAPSIALSELSDISPLPTAVPTKTTGPSSSGHVIEPSPTKSPTAQTYLTSTLPREPVEEILSWLKRLDINLKNASALQDPSATLREFQSGVLLCCIVEKVEFMRSIPGITRPSGKQPLSKASSLHNITKALAILQQKKTMPLHLLRRAAGIYAGDRGVILQLLLQIRKAYGHHHAPRRRHRHQQQQQQQQQQSHSSAA